ncbi:MAG TPA: uroporphyrinogen-III synthase [Alphaproteobacteria bacterium]|nr:uroporphyrinogen-III synthase [Alphaproteobacteria bacterium]
MKILVTRPRADAEELAKLLAARGHEALIEPLLDIATLPGDAVTADGVQALVFTSANGVRALIERNGGDISALRALPVYTVGDATARAARDAGFADVVSASGDVNSLAELIIARVRPDIGPLLHVSGSDVAGDLAGQLTEKGFTLTRAALYQATKADSLSAEAVEALKRGEVKAALFYSPRTASAFAALAGDIAPALGRATAICLSPAVAEAVEDLPGAASWRDILTAAEPTQDALLAALDRFVERETRPKASAPGESASGASDNGSPLPPPIFSDSYDAPPRAADSKADERPSWGSRAALALVGALLIGGVAVYVAKPALVQSVLAFDWLPSWRSVIDSSPKLVEQPAPQAQPAPSAALPPPTDNSGDNVDALRRELAQAQAQLRDAQRDAPVSPDSLTPSDLAPAETSPPEMSPEVVARLDQLEDKLGQLADRPVLGPESLRSATDAVSSRLARLDESLSALTQKLEAQTAAQERERARAARAEALAFTALALRDSLDSGAPFANALPNLRPLAQEVGLGADADLAAPAAAKGVAGIDDLRARLMALIAEVMRAEAGPPDTGLFARLWRSLSSSVVIRRVADDAAILNAADPADRLFSRAERRLAVGDLDGAIAPVELLIQRESLTPGSRQALEAWLTDARARRAAERLAAALLQNGLIANQGSGRAPGAMR